MILVDTSVWVEFLRATGSAPHLMLRRLIERGSDIAVTEPVVMELLAGARSEHDADRLLEQLLAFAYLPVAGLVDAIAAASIHRRCRGGGQPVRNQIDCLIAAVAIREGASILHDDADFDVIARHTELRTEPISA